MRAEKVGADTVLAHIVAMVAAARRSRAPIQRIADTVAGYFVPVVIAIAIAAFAAWAIWGLPPAFAYALIVAVSVVIIACPCALGLATPMSIMVGIGKGAGSAVLIKSAEALVRMEKVDTCQLRGKIVPFCGVKVYQSRQTKSLGLRRVISAAEKRLERSGSRFSAADGAVLIRTYHPPQLER